MQKVHVSIEASSGYFVIDYLVKRNTRAAHQGQPGLHCEISFQRNKGEGAGKMVQWGKKLAAKSDDLSSVPRTHLVERELSPLSSPVTSKYTSRHMHMYKHMCTHKYKQNCEGYYNLHGIAVGALGLKSGPCTC